MHFMKTSIQSSTPLSWSSSPAELEILHPTPAPEESEQVRQGSVCKGEARLSTTPERVGHYAEPISPLKERDLVALATLFQSDGMVHVEADVNQMLLRLLPEPCWEEDPFEFLKEFL
jgi:hypothetical protein